MAKYSEEAASDEVADLQASLDPSRSEALKPVIMDHVHRYLRAKSNTDKFMELEGLISFCLPYIRNRAIKIEIEKLMGSEEFNFSDDFIRNYKNESSWGVPWHVILENEYRKLLPRMKVLWFKVQQQLVDQELIPWSLSYPEKILEGALIEEIMADLQGGAGLGFVPPRDQQALPPGRPPQLPQRFDEDYDYREDRSDNYASDPKTPPIKADNQRERYDTREPAESLGPPVFDDERPQSGAPISNEAAATMSDILLLAAKNVKEGNTPPPGGRPLPPGDMTPDEIRGTIKAARKIMEMAEADETPVPKPRTRVELREYSDEELEGFEATDEEMEAGARAMRKLLEEKGIPFVEDGKGEEEPEDDGTD